MNKKHTDVSKFALLRLNQELRVERDQEKRTAEIGKDLVEKYQVFLEDYKKENAALKAAKATRNRDARMGRRAYVYTASTLVMVVLFTARNILRRGLGLMNNFFSAVPTLQESCSALLLLESGGENQ